MRRLGIPIVGLCTLALVGCGAAAASRIVVGQVLNTNAGADNIGARSESADRLAQPAQTPAGVVLQQLAQSIPTIKVVEDYGLYPSDDPDKLLGAPGEYTSKIAFVDSAADGSPQWYVEVFPTSSNANRRLDNLSTSESDVALGRVIVRLPSAAPTLVATYQAALGTVVLP
jgi:hypothetical protein